MLKKLALLSGVIFAMSLFCAALDSNVDEKEPIHDWITSTDKGNFEIGMDKEERHSGMSSAYIKSVTGASPRML